MFTIRHFQSHSGASEELNNSETSTERQLQLLTVFSMITQTVSVI